MLDACLEILVRCELLRQEGDSFCITDRVVDPALLNRLDRLPQERGRLVQEAGWTEPFLTVLTICLERYGDVLRGRVPATEVLFGKASMGVVERLYRENPIVDFFNAQVAAAVGTAIKEDKEETSTAFRVLEIGAGTGGTTGSVLAVLATAGRIVEYHYTDISPGFTHHGKARFGKQYPFVRFGLLDIENDPAPQGHEPRSFDLVVATNVLHATRNIERAVHHARRLLRGNGLLILNEATQRHDFSTLTFGLTEGWWRFEDQDRRLPHSPLLDEVGWRHILAAQGFDPIQSLGGEALGLPQSVFLARVCHPERSDLKKSSGREESRSDVETGSSRPTPVKGRTPADLVTERLAERRPRPSISRPPTSIQRAPLPSMELIRSSVSS